MDASTVNIWVVVPYFPVRHHPYSFPIHRTPPKLKCSSARNRTCIQKEKRREKERRKEMKRGREKKRKIHTCK